MIPRHNWRHGYIKQYGSAMKQDFCVRTYDFAKQFKAKEYLQRNCAYHTSLTTRTLVYNLSMKDAQVIPLIVYDDTMVNCFTSKLTVFTIPYPR